MFTYQRPGSTSWLTVLKDLFEARWIPGHVDFFLNVVFLAVSHFWPFCPSGAPPGNIISTPVYIVVVHEAGRYRPRPGSTSWDTVLKDLFEARWIGLPGRVKSVTFRVLSSGFLPVRNFVLLLLLLSHSAQLQHYEDSDTFSACWVILVCP